LLNPVPAGSLIKITFPPEIRLRDLGQVYLRSIYKSGKNGGNVNFSIGSVLGRDVVSISDAIQEYRNPGSKLLFNFSQV
jgi:hypothetical protein